MTKQSQQVVLDLYNAQVRPSDQRSVVDPVQTSLKLVRMSHFNRGKCAFLESTPTSRGGLWRWGPLGGAGWGLAHTLVVDWQHLLFCLLIPTHSCSQTSNHE
jgi:hypothetical protein